MFHSHLQFSKELWLKLVPSGGIYIDATCGNGHDTLFLAENLLTQDSGSLYAIDIQENAIKSTKKKLLSLPPQKIDRIHFFHQSHENFPSIINQAHLIVYNLGYLPGSDQKITTLGEITIKSLQNALEILDNQGLISITVYPGHSEGTLESQMLLDWCSILPSKRVKVQIMRHLNKPSAPFLLTLQKK